MIFSDLDQRMGRYEIRDVLDHVSSAAVESNPDFAHYKKQKLLRAEGRETELRSLDREVARRLEKYKMLHSIEHAWELQPEKDWYVFMKVDTYLIWPNLSAWLKNLDPRSDHYGTADSITHGNELTSGSDGDGLNFVLSGATVRKFASSQIGPATRWESKVQGMNSSYAVLSAALREELSVIPTETAALSSRSLMTMPYGEAIWCQPAIMLSHLTPRQFDEFYKHSLNLNHEAPLRFKDVYNATYLSGLAFMRKDWENSASDPAYSLEVMPNKHDTTLGQWEPKDLTDPHHISLGCELACIQNEQCFQYSFVTTTTPSSEIEIDSRPQTRCHLSSAFRLGNERLANKPVDGQGDQAVTTYMSGWRSDRIAKWIEEHRHCP